MNIAEQIKKDMAQFKAITTFLNSNFAEHKRVTVEQFARSIKIKKDDIVPVLQLWLDNAVRGDRCPSNVIHKFSIFYDIEHRKPRLFSKLNFTAQELSFIHLSSLNFDTPGYMYSSRYRNLLLNRPDGLELLKAQMEQTWEATTTCLRQLVYVAHNQYPAYPPINDDNLRAAALPGMAFSNQSNHIYYEGMYCNLTMIWARRTIEVQETFTSINPEEQEIICLAPADETAEARALRKSVCTDINRLKDLMASRGMYLFNISNKLSFKTRSRSPSLSFISKGDAMTEVKITLTCIKDVGKFVLN